MVGAHGAIGAQAEEQALHGFGVFDLKGGVVIQAGMADIIVDADGEVVLGFGLAQLIEDALDHGRGELFGSQAVAPADDAGRLFERQRCPGPGLR